MSITTDGSIYAALLEAAKAEQPYDVEQLKVIESTTARLIEQPTSAARPGMLLGKIQSGKTKTFLGVIALAVDNGYSLVLVLTKGTKALSEETLQRMLTAFGASVEEDLLRIFDIMSFPPTLTRSERKGPIVIVAKKETQNLQRLAELLFTRMPELGQRRTLIVDDEADFASIGYAGKDADGVAKMQKIMSQIDALRRGLHAVSFLQVTATPYSLYLQPRDMTGRNGEAYRPIRPAFTELVPTHGAYIGGDFYFGHNDAPQHVGSHVFVPVETEELQVLEGPDKRRFKLEDALTSPKVASLRRAVIDFVVGASIRRLQSKFEKDPPKRYSFVLHSMVAKSSHQWQCDVVTRLSELLGDLAEHDSPAFASLVEDSRSRFVPSVEAAKTYLPPLSEVVAEATRNIEKIKIEKVNTDAEMRSLLDTNGQLKLTNALTIFVGGSILDRGLTIANLIGFYYGRRAQKLQQDTVLQHHRMYGARPAADMAVTRFYTTATLHASLRTIHEFDAALRASLESGGDQSVTFLHKEGSQIVPCSPNKILASTVTTLRAGKRLLPVGFQTLARTRLVPMLKVLDAEVDVLAGPGIAGDAPVLINVAIAERLLKDAVAMFDLDAAEMAFNIDATTASLRHTSNRCPDPTRRGKVYLLVRRERAAQRVRSDGRFYDVPDTSEAEGEIARTTALDAPMLMLFRQRGDEADGWRGSPFYWPVVHMPQQMGTVVFANDTIDYDEDAVAPDAG